MPFTAPFYSANEAKKPAPTRVHHNNTTCPSGRDISHPERRLGTGGYQLCNECKQLTDQRR
jgi:hypothetical protein